MTRERGQVLIEVVASVPACIACALLVADCGVVVRDRVAVAQAAGRAAEARLVGTDARDAALGALPESLRDAAVVRVADDHVIVRVEGESRLARLAGRPIVHRSRVEVAR